MVFTVEQTLRAAIAREHQNLGVILEETKGWCGLRLDALVRLEAAFRPIRFSSGNGYLLLTKYVDRGRMMFRRYRFPFVQRVLRGSFTMWTDEWDGPNAPRFLFAEQTMTPGAEYGLFSPRCWQRIELLDEPVYNLVITGPLYPLESTMLGFGGEAHELFCDGVQELLAEFRQAL